MTVVAYPFCRLEGVGQALLHIDRQPVAGSVVAQPLTGGQDYEYSVVFAETDWNAVTKNAGIQVKDLSVVAYWSPVSLCRRKLDEARINGLSYSFTTVPWYRHGEHNTLRVEIVYTAREDGSQHTQAAAAQVKGSILWEQEWRIHTVGNGDAISFVRQDLGPEYGPGTVRYLETGWLFVINHSYPASETAALAYLLQDLFVRAHAELNLLSEAEGENDDSDLLRKNLTTLLKTVIGNQTAQEVLSSSNPESNVLRDWCWLQAHSTLASPGGTTA